METYIQDVKQGQKVAPDFVESIVKPTDPVKEELCIILLKMNHFRPKITEIRVCTFGVFGKITDSANLASKTVISGPPDASGTPFSRHSAQPGIPKNFKICMDLAPGGRYSKKLWF